MMDLKEIIKWFIPCFHILLVILKNKDLRLTFFCLFLLFYCRVECAASASDVRLLENNAKNVDLIYNKLQFNQSDAFGEDMQFEEFRPVSEGSVGRTFGRPFKKMMAAMIPLIFQVGAASTWAVVAALVGIKTLFVTLVILKILLVAGAAKVGALFGSKGHGHYQHGWEAPQHPHHPQKEIHLHIHNGGHQETHEVPSYGPWSREDPTALDSKHSSIAIDPYAVGLGPQTIRTPFGNYVKVDSNDPLHSKRK